MTPYAYPAIAFGVLLVVVVLLEVALKLKGKPLLSSFSRWLTREIRGGWTWAFGLSMLLAHLTLTETVAMTPWRWGGIGLLAAWAAFDVVLSYSTHGERTFSAWFQRARQRTVWANLLPLVAGLVAGKALW
jgi:hypothetical protein